MTKNKIYTLFFCVTITSCSIIKKENTQIIVKIEQNDIDNINIEIKNISDEKFIIPNILLTTGNILKFDEDSDSNYSGPVVDATYPSHLDKESIDYKKLVDNECYLQDTVYYKTLLPNQSFIKEYKVNKYYNGLKKNKTYKIQYHYVIASEYSDFCPLIWSGVLLSNKINFTLSQ